MQQIKKQAFTLVELIVVITIIAILGTIAFISLQGYSSQARDSKRLSDIQNIKKSLELFSLNTGKYPQPDNQSTVSYDTQDLWYQGTIGDQVKTNLSRNLNKKPTDPLTDLEYTYSRTYKGNEYELLSVYESDLVSFLPPLTPPLQGGEQISSSPYEGEARRGLFSQTNASNSNYTKIDGTYNGVFIKSGEYIIPTPSIINSEIEGEDIILDITNITSQIITGGENNLANAGIESITGGLEGMSLQVFTGTLDKVGEDDDLHKRDLLEILQQAYTNTSLANNGIYQEILTTSLTSTGEVIELIDNLVLGKDNYSISGGSNDGGDDIPAETTGLITSTDCTEAGWYWVSPEDDEYATTTIGDGYCISPRIEGNGDNYGISWNDSGTSATWREWNTTGYSTTEGLADDLYGITAYLSDYTCGALNSGHTNVDGTFGDTIKGRMKWLTQYANMSNNYSALNSIDWIDITLNTSNTLPIPSIYIADCIDGVKDLTTDITLGEETITWGEYTSTIDSDATRIIRNKYLLGWSKESGSHLPSAYSSMDYEVGDNLTLEARGEYQVACELYNTNTDIITDFYEDGTDDSSSGDNDDGEFIGLSAVGSTDGTYWGRSARIVGYNGCGDQSSNYAGNRITGNSARFVVRP